MSHLEEHEYCGNSRGLAMAMNIDTTRSMRKKNLKCSKRKTPSVASSMRSASGSGFRMRRAFLVGQRGSPSTPVPSWKVYDQTPIPVTMDQQQGQLPYHHHCQWRAISARKLAASLWELQEVPFSRRRANGGLKSHIHGYVHHNNSSFSEQSMCQGHSLSPASSHIKSTTQSKFEVGGQNQSLSASFMKRASVLQGFPETKIHVAGAVTTPKRSVLGIKAIAANLGLGGQTTSELLKVLNYVWSLEEQQASTMSLVQVLRTELDKARSQLQDLLLKENDHSKEVENVTERMIEERVLWQEQQEESIRVAILSITLELENERKSRQKLKLLHKRVSRDLKDARKSLCKVLEDLERERKARELMEDVCDELAREIGEDKAKVEELKRESLKVREEVEEERKMLQMAEVWREERVQMKLTEAKLELEEKNTAVDKLRSELETFLKVRRAVDSKNEPSSVSADVTNDMHRHSLDANLSYSNEQRGLVAKSTGNNMPRQTASRGDSEGHDTENDLDLHSIELNNDSYEKSGSSQNGPQQCIEKGRRCTDQRASFMRQSPQRSFGGSPRGGNGPEECLESQWIECSFEGGELREWSQEQQQALKVGEEGIRLWQIDTGNLHDLIMYSPRGRKRNAWHQVESTRLAGASSGSLLDKKESRLSRNSSFRLHRTPEIQNDRADSMLDHGHQGFKMILNNHVTSQDEGSHLPSELLRGLMDTSLKMKLLEAKFDGQQAWLKAGKGF